MVLTLIGAGLVVLTCSLSMAGDPQAKETEQPTAPKSIVGVGEGVQNVVWSPNGKFLAVLTNIYDVAEQDIKGEKKKILFDYCTLMLWDVDREHGCRQPCRWNRRSASWHSPFRPTTKRWLSPYRTSAR
jgi:hypothetical protein